MIEEPLNDLQFAILDSLYFVEPFQKILEEVDAPAKVVADELKILISKRYVQVMRFDEKVQDYIKSIFYDTDDMHAYSYLATREGLLKHAGR